MKCAKKILLSFLMLIYLTHVYSRLVHTPPLYVIASSNVEKTVGENEQNSAPKSFILHRRHLPLTKKIEIGKLYPHLNASLTFTTLVKVNLIHTISTDYPIRFPFIGLKSNKAPPFS